MAQAPANLADPVVVAHLRTLLDTCDDANKVLDRRYVKGLLPVDGRWPPGPEVVKTAVREATDAVAGDRELGRVVDVELRLDWQSDTTPNLDIIDLPGLVAIPLAGQPDDIPQQIESIVNSYISDTNTLVMCVFSGVVDVASFKAIKVAQNFDKNLSRTLVVITKLDMFQSAEEQQRCLQKHLDNLRSYKPIDVVLVKNSGIEDLATQVASEREFVALFRPLQEKEKQSFKLGTPELVARLTLLLIDNINQALPVLKGRLESSISALRAELAGIPQVLSKDGAKEKAIRLLITLGDQLRNIMSCSFSRIITYKSKVEANDTVHANLEDIFNHYFEKVIKVPPYLSEDFWKRMFAAYKQHRGKSQVDYHDMEAQTEIYFTEFVKELGFSMQQLVEDCYQCVKKTYDAEVALVFRDFDLVQKEVKRIFEEEVLRPQKAALMLYTSQTAKARTRVGDSVRAAIGRHQKDIPFTLAEFDIYTRSPIYSSALSYYGKKFGTDDSTLMPEVSGASGSESNDPSTPKSLERASKVGVETSRASSSSVIIGALGVEKLLLGAGDVVLTALSTHGKDKEVLNIRKLQQEQWSLFVYNVIVHNSMRDMVPRAVKLFLLRELALGVQQDQWSPEHWTTSGGMCQPAEAAGGPGCAERGAVPLREAK
ncbi:Dynamin-2 [Tetrabaena socialis]|uniref:Dynamin-2 n=1 Tax=Tetrabaena socialis TaxID=47790 RepID=A0A2J7ZZZ7_9CHLO|nr:Dynamin-2 [Tetrabaena socialis]|eukprot:PNH05843.1 Dynamin-2 [Tetrabaena socialis]